MIPRPFRVLGWTLLAFLGLATAVFLWRQAFPFAAIDLQCSKPQAEALMQSRVESFGYPLKGYQRSIFFYEDSETKNFIELEAGLEALQEFAAKGVNVWCWSGRWFKPEQEEEFYARVDPQGHLVLFSHRIEENRAAPTLERKEALKLAEDFLRVNVTQHPFNKLRLVEDSRKEKPRRVDHTFVWEQEDLRVKSAPYRLIVTIKGDHVGAYSEYLKVPESWTRDFERKRELNHLLYWFASYGSIPITFGIIVLFFLYAYRRKLDWVRVLPWGWLAFMTLVLVADQINQISSILYYYKTTEVWSSYLAEQISSSLRGPLLAALGVWFIVLVADPLYREKLPQFLSFRTSLGRNALTQPEVIRSIGLGTVFACLSLAYVGLFYAIGRHFGVWSPVEIDYSKTLSGTLPWIEPLKTGLFAAFNEEMTYRVVGILLYWKLFRNKWVAVVLSAVTWAFLHSTYPQMPGYIRGLELTVVGIVWGMLMLRFGIVTTLTAHYLYNCWLGSAVLFYSPSVGDRLGALVVAVWPLAFGLWGWLRLRRHAMERKKSAIVSSDDEFADDIPVEETAWDFLYRPLSAWSRALLLTGSLAALAAISTVQLPQDSMARLGDLVLSRKQAAEKTDAIMKSRGLEPSSYKRILTLDGNNTRAKYLLQFDVLDSVAALFETEWPDVFWRARYFRPEEKEEFNLKLDKHGNLWDWGHTVLDESPGASLEKSAALALVQKHLQETRHINTAREKIVEEDLDQQEKRKDYTFIFERRHWKWGEAKLRTAVDVQGDEIVGFDRYIKVPDAWEREQERSGWKDAVVRELSSWLGIGIAILVVVVIVWMIRKKVIPWKLGFKLALIPAILEVILWFNDLPWFYSNYSTTTPLLYHAVQSIGGSIFSLAMAYLLSVVVVGLSLGLMQLAFGWNLSNLELWPAEPLRRCSLWTDGIILAIFSVALFWSKDLLDETVCGWLFPERVASFYYPSVNSAAPWLASLAESLKSSYAEVVRVGIKAAAAVLIYRKIPRMFWLLLFLYPIYNATGENTWAELAYTALSGELRLILYIVLIWRIWRFNVLAIFLFFFYNSMFGEISVFLYKGGPGYQGQAVPLIIACLLPLLIAAYSRLRGFSSASENGAGFRSRA